MAETVKTPLRMGSNLTLATCPPCCKSLLMRVTPNCVLGLVSALRRLILHRPIN